MRLRLRRSFAIGLALVVLVFAGYAARDGWRHRQPLATGEPVESSGERATAIHKVIVNERAQENLGLAARPLKAQTYWKTITVPGMIVDRPGLSDRGIITPVAGVVIKVNHVPGDVVPPGEVLFTIRVLSESLHQTQTDLYKATQDVVLARAQWKRLAASGGAVPEAKVIEVENQIKRLEVVVTASRQELLSRGFTSEQIDGVAGGTFVREVPVVVPHRPVNASTSSLSPAMSLSGTTDALPTFEVQELKVDLGQQVQAGQTLCLVADHRRLAVEGRAFRDETPLLERSVTHGWPVEVDFQEESGSEWPAADSAYLIRHLSNSIDPVTRTFAFYLPLENQSRVLERDGRTQTLWRFRPGQKVRLHVRVERLDNVFVLPVDAVARDGPESFVFTQNDNTFERKPVRVVLRDRQQVVVANDGSLPSGSFVVQAGAAQLNRMVKMGGASGVPKGYHVHADGSLHKNEDEGK